MKQYSSAHNQTRVTRIRSTKRWRSTAFHDAFHMHTYARSKEAYAKQYNRQVPTDTVDPNKVSPTARMRHTEDITSQTMHWPDSAESGQCQPHPNAGAAEVHRRHDSNEHLLCALPMTRSAMSYSTLSHFRKPQHHFDDFSAETTIDMKGNRRSMNHGPSGLARSLPGIGCRRILMPAVRRRNTEI